MGAYDPMSYGQFTTGIVPTPGTPAYAEMIRRIQLNQQSGLPGISQEKLSTLPGIVEQMRNTGTDFGLLGGGGGTGSAFSSSSSSRSGGGGGGALMDEILALIRGTGEKQFGTARARLGEDIAQARMEKTRDLTRRGLFRGGTGEEEIQREIEKPYMRGMSDLESNMADANVDVGLRKASILADIEAAQRKAAAEAMANAGRAGASGYGGGGGGGGNGGGGDGAAFPGVTRLNASRKGGSYITGANFVNQPPPPPPDQSAQIMQNLVSNPTNPPPSPEQEQWLQMMRSGLAKAAMPF